MDLPDTYAYPLKMTLYSGAEKNEWQAPTWNYTLCETSASALRRLKYEILIYDAHRVKNNLVHIIQLKYVVPFNKDRVCKLFKRVC